MALIKSGIVPENLPLLQISKNVAFKCSTEKPTNYVSSNSREALVSKLKSLRQAYSLLVLGTYRDYGVSPERMGDARNSLKIDTLQHAKDFVSEYNRIADALLASYKYDICNSSVRKSSNVSAVKVIRQLMKQYPVSKTAKKSATSFLGIGDHLIESRHRLHGLSDEDAINVAISELKKGEDSKPSEIARLVASNNKGMTLADCPKPTPSGSSSTASDNDSKTETYWYNNPLIMLTLGVGATVGVQQVIKRSRG
jgi:hypothetical protein